MCAASTPFCKRTICIHSLVSCVMCPWVGRSCAKDAHDDVCVPELPLGVTA